jgi:hypothetical protein
LNDLNTGRSIIVARPQLDRFPSVDIMDLIEHLAGLWFTPGGRATAAQGLNEFLDTEQPLFGLRTLNWVHVVWIAALSMRSDRSPADLIRRMQPYDAPAGMPADLLAGATERIRVGMLGELRGDPRAHAVFDREALVHRAVTRSILEVTLTLMEQTQEVMHGALGFRLENCAMSVARCTTSLHCELPPFTVAAPDGDSAADW